MSASPQRNLLPALASRRASDHTAWSVLWWRTRKEPPIWAPAAARYCGSGAAPDQGDLAWMQGGRPVPLEAELACCRTRM
jgi:hypothetical protein